MDTVLVYSDGGARGNPGPAAIGVALYGSQYRQLVLHGEFIGEATNNQAEYKALITGLNLSLEYNPQKVVCTSDSQLVVKQMRGEYQVKNKKLKILFEKAKRVVGEIPVVEFRHVKRENKYIQLVDDCLNKELDKALL